MKSTTMALFLCLTLTMTIAAKDVEIALEAELANTIQAPMVIAVPADVDDAGGPKPDEPSNGEFVWAPGAPVTGGGGSGYAEYIINIPENDTYAIWAHIVAWDGNSDSFWVTWTPADDDEDPQVTKNFDFRWAVNPKGNAWAWDRINHWLDAGTFEREWEFDKGETVLKIWSREDATMLDTLFITNNNNAVTEGDANVRLPDDDDREAQILGTSRDVDPKEKLATTWAKIRTLSF